MSNLFKLFILLVPSSFVLSQTKSTNVFWQSWDLLDISDEGNAAPSTIQILQGFTGTTKGPLVKSSDGTTKNGDLIELGYFDTGANSPNTDSTNLFVGTWTPLTSTTTIGLYPTNAASNSVDGLFYLSTQFAQGAADGSDEDAKSLLGTTRAFTDDLGSALDVDIAALDTATSGSTYARLGIRFYDVSQSADTGGTSKASGTTRYNTIMAESWRWADTSFSGSVVELALHNPTNQAATTGLVFEFDNSDGNGLGAKFGSSDTAVGTDDYVASLTYHDGSSDIDLDTLGSTVLSGLSGSGDLMGGDNGDSILTLHSSAGNTGASAYEFTGNIYESNSAHSDLSVLKTGTGDQILSGNINLEASSGDEGYINLQQGGLTLDPDSGETQVIEYLKGASGTTLTLDSTGAGTLELGFAETHASSEATFAGNVALTGSGSSNIIKVSSGTDSADYLNEQVISGIVSGSEKLTKSGVGRLKLSGDSTFSGGMDINDGTVVADHADALGGSGNTVTINKGKLEVNSGVTLTNNTIQGGSGKSLIGGDGTVGTITIGNGANEIDYLSPGQGISSSLTPSQKQVGLGNGAADDAIGSFTATTLSLQGGGVYDWELQDFDGTTGGTDYDVMNFTNLSFGSSSDRFIINIMGIKSSDGTAGAPDNLANIWSKSRQGAGNGSTNGFKFLTDGSGTGGGITWGAWNAGNINDYFDFRFDDLAYNTSNNGQYNQWGQDWSVLYDNGDFYLQFSAAPEPSTYIMVTGLFMLPGYRLIRRFRKSFNSTQEIKEDT